MDNYIRNKNYLALYLNSAGMEFSSALVLSFIGVSLFLQGLPLYLVFLYFGLEFLARAVFSPLSSMLATKYGIKPTILIANGFLILYFLAVSLFAHHPELGFFSFILHSLSRGIYYPLKHFMQAKFIQNDTRGRFLTLEIVIISISAALAVGFATYSATVWHSFLPPAVVAGFFICVSSFSIVKLLGDIGLEHGGSYRSVIQHFTSSDFSSDRTAFMGFAVSMGFNNVVLALLVYFVVDSLKLFGVLMVTVFLVEMVLTLIYGRLIDKDRVASNKLASFVQIASLASFLLALTPLLVAVIKTVYDYAWNAFDSSFTARFHEKINKHGLVYACCKEVSIDVASASYCMVLCLMALMWRGAVFPVGLFLAALGVIVAWRKFSD